MTGDAGLQGRELVVHVFVAADAGVGAAADHRWVVDLWDRCVTAFDIGDPESGHPPSPGVLPGEETEEAVLAVRTRRRGGLFQMALRRRHDVLCLSLVLAPDPEQDVAWGDLEASWTAVDRRPTRGVLGSARILQGRLAAEGATVDPVTLGSRLGHGGVLVEVPRLGSFAVWEAGTEQDGRADRRLVVVAAADRDAELSAWTWSRGTAEMTPLAGYLLAAAKLRYELRVWRAARPSSSELRRTVDEVDPREVDALHAVERRLVDRRTRLDDMHRTVGIAGANMARHVRDRTAGPFADDRDLAEWFGTQLANELGYLGAALERVRSIPRVPEPSPAPGPARPSAVRTLVEHPDGTTRDLFPQASVLGERPRELQRVVNRAVGFQDVVPFATGLLREAARVCRVEVVRDAGTTRGTGFLVGPDLMLTNHHVLDTLLDGTTPSVRVRCTFDHHLRGDGSVEDGSRCGLAADGWLVAARPPSPVDREIAPRAEPGPAELDYALVRLDAAPGRDRLPDGTTRGWLDLAAVGPTPEVGTPLLIVQHPAGEPVKHALDTDGVLSVSPGGTRLTYGVNTLPGSSGSPCFTFDLSPVAVHHAGADGFDAGRNEGVPLAAIVADLHRREIPLSAHRRPTPGAGPSGPSDAATGRAST